MKKVVKILLILLVVFVLVVVLILGFLGYIPGLSRLLGANTPRDLGVTYTEQDLKSARKKSQIKYSELPEAKAQETSIIYKGEREVDATFTSAEITASLNDQDWVYWPIEDVQIRFNADGSTEISGVLLTDRIRGFGAAIDMEQAVIDGAMKFLPPDPAFYVKGKASLKDNKVEIFEPQSFQIGRISLPVSVFLSFAPELGIPTAYAASVDEITTELDKVDNKRQGIINYINRRLSAVEGFYAEEAYFADDELVYDGTLSAEIQTAQ